MIRGSPDTHRLLFGPSISIFVLLVFIVFCPIPVRAQDTQQYIDVDGSLQSFVIHLPIGYDPGNKYPVVILLHSTDEMAQDMQRLSRFDFVADRYGFIAFYPTSGAAYWDIGIATTQANHRTGRRGDHSLGFPSMPFPFPTTTGAEGHTINNKSEPGDVELFKAMLDTLAAKYSVDTNRIFATGYSDGGLMDFRLGCSMSERIAAIAPVAAAMPKQMSTECQPSRAIPILMLNGTSDRVIHYGGGRIKGTALTTLSARATAEVWAKLDHCNSTPARTIPAAHQKGAVQTRLDTYSGCRDRAEVSLYTIEGGDNTWPSELLLQKEFGTASTEVDVDEVIWRFFANHPIPSGSSTEK